MTSRPAARAKLPTRVLLTCAAIGAAGGILTIPLLIFFTAATVATVPFLYAALVGSWFLPAALAQRLLDRPGVALLTMFIAAMIAIPFSPYGAWVVLSTSFAGLVMEVPWVVTGFRRLIPAVLYGWVAVWGVVYGLWIFADWGAGTPAPAGSIPILAGIVAVSHLAAVALGRSLGKALLDAGVGGAVPRVQVGSD